MKKILCVCFALAAMATANAQGTVAWGVKAGVDVSNISLSMKDLSPSINLGNKAGFYVGAVNNISFGEKFGLQTELQYTYGGTRIGIGEDIMGALGGLVGLNPEDNAEALQMISKDMKVAVNMHKLYLPIMFKFQPTEGLSVMAGPYMSYRIGTGVKFNDNLNNVIGAVLPEIAVEDIAKDLLKDNLRKFDVGAALGVEYEFGNGMFIDFRYNISLLNSLKKDFDITAVAGEAEEGESSKVNIKDFLGGAQPTLRSSSLQIGVGFRF